ncbi:LuxR C-terminal-related transcriptional regulator [Pseudomonas sp. H9]|uniref:LuxR C-terminal-related transcriptional regulator n=1 Tax=Pseudomonas sp. H9 TaxID=483968 RepID=UPI0010577FCB|nr:LuxR C-terminal-related transcriptional regulator [Pseudomonas sp. H9]TDF83756.1 ATP-dependent transcriptional regulator [Pseudomonas sp. H9]
MSQPLTPTALPRAPSAHLLRERLHDALLGPTYRLRLFCAPAGYGKTVLLNDCMRRSDADVRCLWLDLGGHAPTLAQFCRRLADGLGLPAQVADDADALLAHLQCSKDHWWLAFDDFPTDASVELNAWIDHLLRSQAPVQLWVSCRQRPTWKLARLLLEGQLLELGANELAFTRDELETLVGRLDPLASAATTARLWQQTQGWCAGVKLQLSAQVRNERAGASWLREYLGGELLAPLSGEERDLLLAAAYLPRLSVDFCQRLWPHGNAGALLRGLVQSESFFMPVGSDGQWYRLLPAVALALQGELCTASLNRLRLDTCRLLCEDGFIDEAIELALCTQQPEMAASLMERLTLDWMFSERHLHTWLDWLTRLPLRALDSSPNLIYLNVRALLSVWRLDDAQTYLARLAWATPQPKARNNNRLLANWQALQGTLLGLSGDAQGAREHCQQALQHLELRDWPSSFLCYSTLARVAMAAGEPEEAKALLDSSLQLARRHGCIASEVLINADRIRMLILCNEWELAESVLQECFELVADDGGHHDLLLSRLMLLRGELHLLRGNLPECENLLRAGLQRGIDSSDPYVLHALVGLSEAAACKGELEQAHLHLRSAERHMQRCRVSEGCYKGLIDYQHMRLMVRQQDWQAIVLLARKAIAEGVGRLPPLHAPSLPQRLQLILALAECGLGKRDHAATRLQALLETCEQMGFFSLLPEAQVALVHVDQQRGVRHPGQAPALVRTSLLAGLTGLAGASLSATPGAQDGLTSREFSVLQLVAHGLSNQEISEQLFISLNTVKAHTVKINHKLGVKRRTQAVMRAKSLGMLA